MRSGAHSTREAGRNEPAGFSLRRFSSGRVVPTTAVVANSEGRCDETDGSQTQAANALVECLASRIALEGRHQDDQECCHSTADPYETTDGTPVPAQPEDEDERDDDDRREDPNGPVDLFIVALIHIFTPSQNVR
ncbi:MAG TPA: hypothetical protein VHD84_03140 [Candidatus Saccharimonadales bacterium]|nr:hypothetical protein [Candidatus Saccharimonadales bacterium]